MNFIQALSTTRDDIGFHDYLQPLIKELPMKGGDFSSKKKDIDTSRLQMDSSSKNDGTDKKKKDLDQDQENKTELFEEQLQERKEGRESSYKFFVEVLGWIFYILYLPLKPWIWIVTETSKKLQNLYSGMIVPL